MRASRQAMRSFCLLIGGTATDNGNQAEGQDEGNDEWKELGDGTGKR